MQRITSCGTSRHDVGKTHPLPQANEVNSAVSDPEGEEIVPGYNAPFEKTEAASPGSIGCCDTLKLSRNEVCTQRLAGCIISAVIELLIVVLIALHMAVIEAA